MGSVADYPEWKQIFLPSASCDGIPVTIDRIDSETRKQEEEKFKSSLITSASGTNRRSIRISPHPILFPGRLIVSLEKFQEALNLAISNILDRWFESDDRKDALFRRMPLRPHEEALLRWVQKSTQSGLMKPFLERPGHLRPDLLLHMTEQGELSVQVCEINARFFTMNIAEAFQLSLALSDRAANVPGLQPNVLPGVLLERFCGMFDAQKPIHLVVGREDPMIIKKVLPLLEKHTGIRPKVVHVSDLCLVSDTGSATGYKLCAQYKGLSADNGTSPAKEGEGLEEVHQAGLRLFQDEYSSLSPEILQHLALCSINDMRAIFLLADKRILGIILQELDDLVHQHQVLTPVQAAILRQHIVPTILPGSPELESLTSKYKAGKVAKDDYLIKPCREARSIGIMFGDELPNSEWESHLTSMQDPHLYSNKTQYVIQPVVRSPPFKALLDEESGICDAHFVGMYHVFNGIFSHLGNCRLSPERRCAVAKGGVAVPSVIPGF